MKDQKKDGEIMANEMITVSVRLSSGEYAVLRTIAEETCNTMSGAIRGLINREAGERSSNGKSNRESE